MANADMHAKVLYIAWADSTHHADLQHLSMLHKLASPHLPRYPHGFVDVLKLLFFQKVALALASSCAFMLKPKHLEIVSFRAQANLSPQLLGCRACLQAPCMLAHCSVLSRDVLTKCTGVAWVKHTNAHDKRLRCTQPHPLPHSASLLPVCARQRVFCAYMRVCERASRHACTHACLLTRSHEHMVLSGGHALPSNPRRLGPWSLQGHSCARTLSACSSSFSCFPSSCSCSSA